MASTVPPNTVSVTKPEARLLQREKVMLDFIGELMDSHVSVDRGGLSSGNIVVTHGDPEKVSSIIRKIIYRVDVPVTEKTDEDISQIMKSLSEKFCGQFEADFEEDRSTFTAAFHKRVKAELKPLIESIAMKRGSLPLSPYQINYLQRHLDHVQERFNGGQHKGAVSIKMQKELGQQGTLLISSKWLDFKATKQLADQLTSNLRNQREKLEVSRALYLSSVKGQQELRQLEEKDRCHVSVLLPGHQLLARAESPKGLCVFLCEGNMAATDCNVLLLPLHEGHKDWTPAQKMILDRGLLTTKPELYAELIGCSPKPRTLMLMSQRPGAGKTVVLVYVPDHPDCCSMSVEEMAKGLDRERAEKLTEGLGVALAEEQADKPIIGLVEGVDIELGPEETEEINGESNLKETEKPIEGLDGEPFKWLDKELDGGKDGELDAGLAKGIDRDLDPEQPKEGELSKGINGELDVEISKGMDGEATAGRDGETVKDIDGKLDGELAQILDGEVDAELLTEVSNGPAQKVAKDLVGGVAKGLAEALRLPCSRGTSVAVPARFSTQHSAADNLKTTLRVVRHVLEEDEDSPTTVVVFLETSSDCERKHVTEALEQTLSPRWKVETDFGEDVRVTAVSNVVSRYLHIVLQEENKTASPAAIICAQHQDLEKASSELQNIRVPKEYEGSTSVLSADIKPGSDLCIVSQSISQDLETGNVSEEKRLSGQQQICDNDDKSAEDEGRDNDESVTCFRDDTSTDDRFDDSKQVDGSAEDNDAETITVPWGEDARDEDNNAKDQSKQKAPSFGGTRLLISGIVKRLSENFLKTFLKRVGAADVLSLQMNRNRDKALFVIANENVDLQHLQQVCTEKSVCGDEVIVQSAPISNSVLIQNLNPTTQDEAIFYFFSNKKRSGGGPVCDVFRLDDTRALVQFEQLADTQAVVDKKAQVLDNIPLEVCMSPWNELTPRQEQSLATAYSGSPTLSNVDHKRKDSRGKQYERQHERPTEGRSGPDLLSEPCEVQQYSNVVTDSGPNGEPSLWGRGRGRGGRRGGRRGSKNTSERWDGRPRESSRPFGHQAFYPSYPLQACYYGSVESLDAHVTRTSLPFQEKTPHGFGRQPGAETQQYLPAHQQEHPQLNVCLGLLVYQQLQQDKTSLSHLKWELKDINARGKFKPPDSIIVTSTRPGVPENWKEQVFEKIDKYKHFFQKKVLGEMNQAQLNRDLASELPQTEQMMETAARFREGNSTVTLRGAQEMRAKNGEEPVDKRAEQDTNSVPRLEVIRGLKPCQIKVMSLPQVESRFEEKHKGLSLHMDRENKKLTLRLEATEKEAKKMMADIMEYVTQISERTLPATEAMALLLADQRSLSCTEAMLKKKGVLCRLELKSNAISVSAPTSGLAEQAEDIFRRSFKEHSRDLEEDEVAAAKSSAWKNLSEKLQRRDKEELPNPVLLLNTEKKIVTLLDVAENFPKTWADVKTFFSIKKVTKLERKIYLNHCKFLTKCCKEKIKLLKEKAAQVGVLVNIGKNGHVDFTGLTDDISVINGEMVNLLKSIQMKKKVFSGPGIDTYLNSSAGQLFIEHTGQANLCLVTTSGDNTFLTYPNGFMVDRDKSKQSEEPHDAFSEVIQPNEGSSSAALEAGDVGSNSVEKTMWKSIAVLVYSCDQEAIQKVLKEIREHIKQNQATKEEQDEIICNFSPQQLSAVTALQKKYEVVINMDAKRGTVKITGFQSNVLEAYAALKDIKSEASMRDPITGTMPILWQHEVSEGKFRNFDPEDIRDIEAAYNRRDSSVTLTNKQGGNYKVVFEEKKVLDLFAQPVSVRRIDVLQGNIAGTENPEEIPLPSNWEPMDGTKVKLVDLDPFSNEYKDVLMLFGNETVKKIQRVQNPTLFQQYKVKKKEVEMHNPPGTENEKRLWHGTDSKNIDSITTNGFNRSYCGQHGTAFGQGVYFATDSALARRYTKDSHILQARVLVGQSTPGHKSLRMPPNKPGSARPYDSLNGPRMFVIFHDTQAYPEYLLTL